jgi:hypothetical protein
MPDDTDLDAKLAKLEEDKQKRTAQKEAKAKARRVEELELEAKYVEELGPRGVKFDIVSNELGNFVLRLAEFVKHKQFNARVGNGNVSEEDVFAFVLPSVIVPDRETAQRIFREHVQVAWRCAGILQAMSAAEGEGKAGK